LEARVRSRTKSVVDGTVTYPGPAGPIVGGPGSTVILSEVCNDFWKKKRRRYDPQGQGFPCSNLNLDRIERQWAPLHGGGINSWNFHRVCPNGVRGNVAAHISLGPRDQGNSYYVTKLLAETNPFRPYYSAPVAFKELLDVTTLFKLAAGTIYQFVGSTYLNYRFGWKAFLEDIKTLSKVVEAVNSRVKEINSLQQLGGLRRSVRLDNFGSKGSGTSTIQSTFGTFLYCRYTKSTKKEVWGSVRWYPRFLNAKPLPTTRADIWLTAVKQVFDIEDIDAYTAYQMIPWSWLLDYFVDIGTWLGSKEGRAYVEPKDICIMRRTTTIDRGVRAYQGNSSDSVSGGDYTIKHETLDRVGPLTPSGNPLHFTNLLTDGEIKILLALFLRFKG